MENDLKSVLVSLVVTGAFLVIAAVAGSRLSRSQKPYGVLKVAVHVILFLLVLSGVVASIYKLQMFVQDNVYPTIALYVTGLTLLTNLIVGICMIVVTHKKKKLMFAHKLSTLRIAGSIVASILFLTVLQGRAWHVA